MSAIKPGDRIEHKIYGVGTVNKIVTKFDIDWAVITFANNDVYAIPVDYIRRVS